MLSGKVWYEELDLLTSGSRTLGSMVVPVVVKALLCSGPDARGGFRVLRGRSN